MKYDVAVIGAGASGLYLTALLAGSNLKVALIESQPRVGKKLSATGNGQGNLTNVNVSEDKYFGSVCVKNIIGDYQSVLELFPMLFEIDGEGRVYPTGKQASSMTDALRRIIDNAPNVDVYLSTKIIEINKGYVIKSEDEKIFYSEKVVLSTGGKSQKQFGSDGNAYKLATRFGHKISQLYPSLVQLKTNTEDIKTLKGIRVFADVTAIINDKETVTQRGDVIFTEYGVTGNAIFSLSAYLTDKDDVALKISFLPDVSYETLLSSIERKISLGYERSEMLSGTLNNQLGRAIIRKSGSTPKEIARSVKDFRLKVIGSLGFDYAQVTKGGIYGAEVTDNLESKYSKGLYFTGEILDVDGLCGGYNLHWAFSSAKKVASAILNGRDL
ncbi:MAG: aminoacetone oxidase family FAD-binding enzyme [Clostridia bacterium]|nr:aminoacetone oxidase family FAD-binding enzyme [Clostridia bacterium]